MSVKKALVVDDSKLARITLKKKLELRAVDVDMVESATEALSYLQSHQPDIIFMDHLMPEIDGFEATKRIKANPATRHIPVIMCTGKEHEGYLQEATAIGAANILSKPPETDALNAILDMDLTPVVAAPAAKAEAPVFVEPPILQPISVPAAVPHTAVVDADAELIDDSFDADAAFGIETETETAATADTADLIDTSELESLSSLSGVDDAAASDGTVLLGMDDIDSLDQESALASLDALASDDLLSDVTADASIADEALVDESLADESIPDLAALAAIDAEPVAASDVFDAGELEQAAIEETAFADLASEVSADEESLLQTAFAEPSVVEPAVAAPAFLESRTVQPPISEPAVAATRTAAAPAIAREDVLALISAEFAHRVTSLRETIIADLTVTIRRQLDDMRNAVGENSELHDSRLRVLENGVADLAATSAPKTWVLEKLPPALDMARLTDDIAARIAIVQSPDVLPSDDMVSVRARLDEVESELVTLRKREAPVVDSSALQSLLPGLSRQLDALLQQRIPVIVSDISDQVQLQLAYQMNDGRAPAAAASAPSLDNIITTQADVETQINALKKQLNDEWSARLQALVKQLKDQLQHAPLPASVDTTALREQWRSDARDDIRRAFAEYKAHAGAQVQADAPAADANHFEQMLETVTSQFARTQAEYEQKLKQSRLIAIGAVVASVVISAALAIFLK
jgi:CheY-like chemotaxis protein